jgi:hypothetical protein
MEAGQYLPSGAQPVPWIVKGHVRFGSLADICGAKSHVRFTPNSDRESGFPHEVMSALPPKADMCSAPGDVRFVPIADIAYLLDHIIGACKQRRRHFEPKRLGCCEIDNEFKLGWL